MTEYDEDKKPIRRQEHVRMVDVLWRNKGILAMGLGLDPQKIWIRGREFRFNNQTDDRADLVFQDKWDAYRGDQTATCYVLELKSDTADHEVLGQLQKAITTLTKTIRYGHYGRVVGVAVAKRYTVSGLQLLREAGIRCLQWQEPKEGVYLRDLNPPTVTTWIPKGTKKKKTV